MYAKDYNDSTMVAYHYGNVLIGRFTMLLARNIRLLPSI